MVTAELVSQNRSACFGVKNYDFTKITVTFVIPGKEKKLENVNLIPLFAINSHH